jgi:hypothetical protein
MENKDGPRLRLVEGNYSPVELGSCQEVWDLMTDERESRMSAKSLKDRADIGRIYSKRMGMYPIINEYLANFAGFPSELPDQENPDPAA